MTIIKVKRKTKQKRGRSRVRNKIKMTTNVGSVSKIESIYETFDEVKKRKCKLLYYCKLFG